MKPRCWLLQRVSDAEHLLERAGHRSPTGSAGEHKSSVDVEEDEFGRGRVRQLSERTFDARGPFADGSSSKLTR